MLCSKIIDRYSKVKSMIVFSFHDLPSTDLYLYERDPIQPFTMAFFPTNLLRNKYSSMEFEAVRLGLYDNLYDDIAFFTKENQFVFYNQKTRVNYERELVGTYLNLYQVYLCSIQYVYNSGLLVEYAIGEIGDQKRFIALIEIYLINGGSRWRIKLKTQGTLDFDVSVHQASSNSSYQAQDPED